MSETFSIRHRSGDDDGDNNSFMEWEVTSQDGFFWTELTDMFIRSLMQQSFVISKQHFIEHIEQMECVFNYPDPSNTEIEEEEDDAS